MKESVIYSYGGGEALTLVLNGVAMIFNTGIANQIISFMTLIGICAVGIQAIIQNSYLPKLNWAVKYMLIISLIIQPKGTLGVRDLVHNTTSKIDNLPIGLIVPASTFSAVGYAITSVFEQAFSVAGNIPYMDYGAGFGASLISNARNFKIQDGVFRENMEGFITNCIAYDVLIGNKYTSRELTDTDNIWELVSQNASNLKMINYRNDKGSRELLTCREAATSISNYWKTDIINLTSKLINVFPNSPSSNKAQNDNNSYLGKSFTSNLKVVSDFYGNKSEASNLIMQLMMINAMNDIPASYGVVRAKHIQQDAMNTTGYLAKENLPLLHAVFAALIYASFILILGMLVLPGGFRIFGAYLSILAWIELWAPLASVLNLVINLSSRSLGKDIASGFTLNNISQIVTTQGNLASIAGYLMASIPFISYAVIKGGASQFVHLANQTLGAAQIGVSTASQEVTSGNKSFDNKSIANSQWMNNTGFKTDINPVMKMGHSEYQLADGTIVHETLGGDKIFHAGPGITTSVGSKSINMNNSLSSGIHESMGMEKSLMDQKQTEYSSMEQALKRKAADFVARLAAGENSGEHYSYGNNNAVSRSLSEAVDRTKELSERYGYNWAQAAELGISGGFGLRKGGRANTDSGINTMESKASGLIDKVLEGTKGFLSNSAYLEGGFSGKADVRNISEQGFNEQKGVSLKKGSATNIEDIVRAAGEMQFSTNQSSEKSIADSLTGSYEKMHQLRDSISYHQQNIDRYQRSIENSNSSSFNISDEMYHKELLFIAAQKDKYDFKYGMRGAQKLIEEGGEEFNELHKAFTSKTYGHIQQMRQRDFDNDYKETTKDLKINNPISETYLDAISSAGRGEVGKEGIVESKAKQKAAQQIEQYSNECQVRNKENIERADSLQKKVNKFEKERKFKALFGKNKNVNEETGDY